MMINTCRRHYETAWAQYLIAMGLVLVAGSTRAQTLPVISWQVSEPSITLHEPVILKLLVENTGNESVALDFGANFTQGLLISIIDPSGTLTRRPTLEPKGIVSVGRAEIAPGAKYVREFVLDEWYPFESIGQYAVGVSLRYPITVGSRQVPPPEEVFVNVAINLRDEAALRRRCIALATVAGRKYEDVQSVEEGDAAMKALANMRDPVVVPCLVRLTSHFQNRLSAISALGRFSTPEAVDALIPIVVRRGFDAIEARQALLEIQRRVQQPDLRDKIETALNPNPVR